MTKELERAFAAAAALPEAAQDALAAVILEKVAAGRRATHPMIYQLEVTIRDSTPPIWRRLRVFGESKLSSLHMILQRAFGWTNSHLYQFELGERRITDTEFLEDDASEVPPEGADRVALDDLELEPGGELTYLYDFGDGWSHRIVVEAIFPPAPGEVYPSCVEGARACPPEDCGGVPGYSELLVALGNPRHRRHRELRRWVPAGFDPEAFEAAATTALLQKFPSKSPHLPRRTRK